MSAPKRHRTYANGILVNQVADSTIEHIVVAAVPNIKQPMLDRLVNRGLRIAVVVVVLGNSGAKTNAIFQQRLHHLVDTRTGVYAAGDFASEEAG